MDRQELRRKCFKKHASYRAVAICPLSGRELGGTEPWDLHEVFVKRSSVAPIHQHLIMAEENCIPTDHEAHVAEGNTRAGLIKCIPPMFYHVGAMEIGMWYQSLIDEHGLSLDKGILVPMRDLKLYVLLDMINLGAEVMKSSLPEDGAYWLNERNVDWRARVALKASGKTRKRWAKNTPATWKDYYFSDIVEYLEIGYWTEYMLGALGVLRAEVDWLS